MTSMKSDSLAAPYIKRVYWTDVRKEVQEVNAALVQVVDAIEPGEDLPFYIVSYPFGETIDDGEFYYPTPEGTLALLNDERHPKTMKQDFEHAGLSVPIGVMLKNTMEAFFDTGERIIASKYFKTGDIFALWGHLEQSDSFHPTSFMQMTSGARSFFMFPNIGDGDRHMSLKYHFGVKQPAPKRLRDHHAVFTELVRHPDAQCNWQTQMLLFSGSWIRLLKKDPRFLPLYTFFLEYAWQDSAFWRNKIYFDYLLSAIQETGHMKPNPYLLDTCKSLFMIALGVLPSITVAGDESAGPIQKIQEIYKDTYGLEYTPTCMHSAYFKPSSDGSPVYYSFQYPTTMEFSPRSRACSNILAELDDMYYILSKLLKTIEGGRLAFDHQKITKLLRAVQFDFFHTQPGRLAEIISPTSAMPDGDPRLLQSLIRGAPKKFCTTGAFARGCIRISAKTSAP